MKTQSGIIFESFHRVSNGDIIILEDKSIGSTHKAKFKVRLQTLEEKNQNGRYYDMGIGKEIVESLRPKARGRSLYMEVDHPMGGGDESAARRRAVTVELKNCGALISDIYMKDKEIIGEAETLSGFLGPDFYKTIMYDKADIGFSLRMFGRTQLEESTGLTRVVRPIRPITYDIVTNPSHGSARILEFMTENINQLFVDPNISSEMLTESVINMDDLHIEDNNSTIYEYLEEVLNNTFKTIGPVIFKI